MSNRPDLEPVDTRLQILDVQQRKQVDIPPSRLRKQHGRGRDNLAAHAAHQPHGGIPPAKRRRRLPPLRRRNLVPPFVAEQSVSIIDGQRPVDPPRHIPVDVSHGFRMPEPTVPEPVHSNMYRSFE